jgi:hypothetical protein
MFFLLSITVGHVFIHGLHPHVFFPTRQHDLFPKEGAAGSTKLLPSLNMTCGAKGGTKQHWRVVNSFHAHGSPKNQDMHELIYFPEKSS